MYDEEAQAPQFNFNNLFNKHFPRLIFFAFECILCVNTGVVEGE